MMFASPLLRLPIIVLLASSVSLGLFWFMFRLINLDGNLADNQRSSANVEFIRIKRDSEVRKKQRQKKQPPKITKPQTPKPLVAQQNVQTQALKLNVPNVRAELNLSSQSFLSGAKVGMGFGDSDVLPLVKIRPNYPQRALSRNISGYVIAVLEINPRGTVDKVTVLEAKPAGIFNRDAVRALYRYKFKPKLIDGKASAQTVTQTVKFDASEQE